MVELIIYFLAILNPFALFIYTMPLLTAFDLRHYAYILFRASFISWVIFLFFAYFGNYFFDNILNIHFDSFRIFGGLLLTAFALSFILQGKNSMITTRGELSKIASEVALPFMVGAGTITLSIVTGARLTTVATAMTLTIVVAAAFIAVILLALFRRNLNKQMRIVLDKNLEIFLRLNGFIIGAFGIDLIITGINNLYL